MIDTAMKVVMNGLERYEIIEEIGQGKLSTIYRVICKSGRLRNRHLALKKTIISTPSSTLVRNSSSSTSALHQALHHPNIVSLFSSFCTSLEDFLVLELCSIGCLSDFLHSRNPPILIESELRGLTKSLSDALVYLRKELVVHRDIKPANVFLTGDYGIKLSNFDLAIRFHSIVPIDSKALLSYGSPNYVAPEIILGKPYGFSSDIWSLGCTMIACLSGEPPFDAKTPHGILENICRAAYTIPDHLSSEGQELISSILQVNPEERVYLPNILSHRFFAKLMPIKSLRPPSVMHPNSEEQNQPLPPPEPSSSCDTRHSPALILPARSNRKRLALSEILNTDPRNILRKEFQRDSNLLPLKGYTRRAVSDPILSNTAASSQASQAFKTYSERSRSTEPLADSYVPTHLLDKGKKSLELIGALQENGVPEYEFAREPVIGRTTSTASPHNLQIGTTQPIQFNSTQLNNQTHKTVYGQITILPSRSVLVDFRENQRRRGLKGDEVLVVDPLGDKIAIYSAPHISTPCCLAEPTQRFHINTLPSTYWKQYNDAGRLIDQIKQRTPKLVMYTTAAKCTLMANTPQGDIELLFGAPIIVPRKAAGDRVHKQASMRIRFSRKLQSIEISRCIYGLRGEEWTKKTISSTVYPPYIGDNDRSLLEEAEITAIHHLSFFVQTCEAAEEVIVTNGVSTSGSNAPTNPDPISTQTEAETHQISKDLSIPTLPLSLSSINITPRPKLSTGGTAQLVRGNRDTDDIFSKGHPHDGCVDLKSIQPQSDDINPSSATWFKEFELTNENIGLQTRYIPSVGWCMRYSSSVSQCGRYRIMFLDGVALDIDVDEDWVEMKSQSGNVTRYNIRDCNSRKAVGERMKVFEEFVSLFDDSQQD